MSFNSYEYVFAFLPLTISGFWLLLRFSSRRIMLGWVLTASIAFYLYASLTGLMIILPGILFDYLIARGLLAIGQERPRLSRVLLSAGIIANIAILGYFKYRNFFLESVNALWSTHFVLKASILPLGLSFITFQKIAFLIDVRARRVSDVSLLEFFVFTLFFPRAIAGPIVRFEEIMRQWDETKRHRPMTDVLIGLCLFSIGLFKKCIIADGVAQFVPATFDLPDSGAPDIMTAWTGVLAFTFQLYFDFSGYSDMALGAARMLGILLPMNFDSPLRASSILNFWARWHMTLTRFLTAYVYTPLVLHVTRSRMARRKSVLQGRRSTWSAILPIVGMPTLVTMLISGFWHGAGWQFIVFGALHGLYLTINQCWRMVRPRFWPGDASYERIMTPIGWILTFFAVIVAFVFFRAQSLTSALSILGGMVGIHGLWPEDLMLLRALGIDIDGGLAWQLFGGSSLWIVTLFLAVMVLPNSLQLLRRFQPALDFPALVADRGDSVQRSPTTVGRLAALRWGLRRLANEGASLTPVTLTILAAMFVLATMALNRGAAFIYWKF